MSTHVDVRLVGQTIKQLRLNNHWTQWQLADAVGYSVRNLRRIESGETISIDTINAVADVFKVSAIDILNGCLFCFCEYKKRHWRPSSYTAYPNLLFTHMHARLSKG